MIQKKWTDRYLLRYLAGRYFLIQVGQVSPDYIAPLEMDDAGAEFWKMMMKYPDQLQDVAEALALKYDADLSAVYKDAATFREQISVHFGGCIQ
ncbi:MAG: PqqD family protein [Bilifractor sp.]